MLRPPMTDSTAAPRLFVLTLLVAGACSSPPPPAPPQPDLLAAFQVTPFPGAAALLEGFSAEEDGQDWRVGDAALFGLELHRDGQVQRWLMRVEVTSPQAVVVTDGVEEPTLTVYRANVAGLGERTYVSSMFGADVSIHAADGALLGQSRLTVPREFLARGFTDVCTAMEEPLPEAPAEQEAARLHRTELAAESLQSLFALMGIVVRDDHLSEILWQVVRKPSLLSIILHLGAKVSLQPRFADTVRAAGLPRHLAAQQPAGMPSWVVPFTVTVNDSPALYADLLVTGPNPPRMLCGGILGLTARHPDDPELRFELTLLAARRAAVR